MRTNLFSPSWIRRARLILLSAVLVPIGITLLIAPLTLYLLKNPLLLEQAPNPQTAALHAGAIAMAVTLGLELPLVGLAYVWAYRQLRRHLQTPIQTLENHALNAAAQQPLPDEDIDLLVLLSNLGAQMDQQQLDLQTQTVRLNQQIQRTAQVEEALQTIQQELETRVQQRTEALQAELLHAQENATQLQHQIRHDGLTGLANRAYFMERLSEQLRANHPTTEQNQHLTALLFIDMDQFKVVNNSLGHLVGDELLIAIARRLESCIPPHSLLARFGGDEFVVLISHLENAQQAEQMAEAICICFREPFDLHEQKIYSTASIGIAVAVNGNKDPTSMLRDADTALYRAKAAGRNRYEMFSERLHLRARRLLKLESQIRQAVERDEFRLYYQPILNTRTKRMAVMETLLRWKHPHQGFLLPQDFIPLAEEAGLIRMVDRWVLKDAFAQMSRWQNAGYAPPPATVNISGQSLLDESLSDFLAELLERYQVPPMTVEVEISEQAAMENIQSSLKNLESLHQLGINCWMDDFGQAYSSLSHLRLLPIDVLKVPALFVRSAAENRAILKAIADMGHALGKRICAEGIETLAQAQVLEELGYDLLQGYLYATPLPAETLEELLRGDAP